MLFTVYGLSLNKPQGNFLLKWHNLKSGIYFLFINEKPVVTYQGLQRAKK